ncbi:hypothetical protein BDW66DRAFT_119589 [Aspergillus desertorum]
MQRIVTIPPRTSSSSDSDLTLYVDHVLILNGRYFVLTIGIGGFSPFFKPPLFLNFAAFRLLSTPFFSFPPCIHFTSRFLESVWQREGRPRLHLVFYFDVLSVLCCFSLCYCSLPRSSRLLFPAYFKILYL